MYLGSVHLFVSTLTLEENNHSMKLPPTSFTLGDTVVPDSFDLSWQIEQCLASCLKLIKLCFKFLHNLAVALLGRHDAFSVLD